MSAHLDTSEVSAAPTGENLPKPYLNADGTLVIPMLADPKYHWWKLGGQTVRKTMEELQTRAGQGGQ
jgi:hypothetical protein